MAKRSGCKQCDEDEAKGLPAIRFKDKETTCFVCKKKVSKVLDLHHTRADLCCLKCEAQYWLDIAFD